MPDSTSNESASSTAVASCPADRQAERERLIDDLAFLVVRQHHHSQRLVMTEGAFVESPMLNPNEKRAK